MRADIDAMEAAARACAVERLRVALAGEGGVPSGALAQFRRIGRWGTCVDCPPCEHGGYPETERCVNTTRYDHRLRGDAPTEADVRALLAERDALADALRTERAAREAAEASSALSAQAAVDAARELGHVAAAAVARADAADAQHAALAGEGR